MSSLIIAGNTYPDVPSILVPKDGGGFAEYSEGGGSSGPIIMGVLRPDAELVETWAYDKMLVADEGLVIPAYSTANQTIRAGQNIDTYDGDPLTYRYFIRERALTIPEYNISTLAKGREEYVLNVGVYEWMYQTDGQLRSLDGTKTYGQYSQMLAAGPVNREVYWSSATAIGVYTSTAYCLNQTLVAPTITSNKIITIKSPSIAIRGHATYLAQTFFEAITDARLQYIIELWRVPVKQDVVKGWAYTSLADSVLDDIANNGGTLT